MTAEQTQPAGPRAMKVYEL